MKRITTQTDDSIYADQAGDGRLAITVCHSGDNCCKTSNLDNRDKPDREQGQLDSYTDPALLDTCTGFTPAGPVIVTLDTGETQNGWLVNWVKILTGTTEFTCEVEVWMAKGNGRVREKTVSCSEAAVGTTGKLGWEISIRISRLSKKCVFGEQKCINVNNLLESWCSIVRHYYKTDSEIISLV